MRRPSSLPRSLPSHAVAIALGLWLGLVSLPAQGQPSTDVTLDDLRRVIDETVESDTYAGSFWGIAIVNLRTGERLYDRNDGRNFMPASNQKLLTAAAALDRLGPTFRYQTRVYADGPVRNGVLDGDLVVRGSGDPTIGGHEQRSDPLQVFRAWADSLKTRGITRITGDVIGDDDVFDDVALGVGWSWDDEAYAYSAEMGGLAFNENAISMRVRGQRPGQRARITWSPFNTNYVTVDNQTTTVRRGLGIDEEYERVRSTNRFRVATTVPAGVTEREDLAIHNPTRFFVHVLREVLERNGIAVDGRAVDVDDVATPPRYGARGMRQVASFTSIPLRDIVQTLNVESHNLYAEQVFKTLAVVDPPPRTGLPPRSAALGARAVKATMGAASVDTATVQVVDGSGLSRQNLVSPRALVQLLSYMWTHSDPDVSQAFFTSLPVGGRNGTLEYRFRGREPASGNVRAKTGTLSNVSALSGVVTSARGTPLAFTIVANHYVTRSSRVRRAQDVIVNALARLSQ